MPGGMNPLEALWYADIPQSEIDDYVMEALLTKRAMQNMLYKKFIESESQMQSFADSIPRATPGAAPSQSTIRNFYESLPEGDVVRNPGGFSLEGMESRRAVQRSGKKRR